MHLISWGRAYKCWETLLIRVLFAFSWCLQSVSYTTTTAIMSDLWVQKMKTYFNRIDFDKDGAITRKDFESMAERFAKESQMAPDHAKILMDSLTGVSKF